ncbi:MAG: hypothetical protein GY953_27760, partial [bacterium]|nr:hypothetical protein [bacterium]
MIGRIALCCLLACALYAQPAADDTAAIQSMVDSGEGEVRLTAGRYRLTKPVVINLDRVGPLSLSGAGVATVIM